MTVNVGDGVDVERVVAVAEVVGVEVDEGVPVGAIGVKVGDPSG